MAKESMKAREVKRAKMCARYAAKRKALKGARWIPIYPKELDAFVDYEGDTGIKSTDDLTSF